MCVTENNNRTHGIILTSGRQVDYARGGSFCLIHGVCSLITIECNWEIVKKSLNLMTPCNVKGNLVLLSHEYSTCKSAALNSF